MFVHTHAHTYTCVHTQLESESHRSLSMPWAVWLRWWECHPITERLCGSIPYQGTYLGCGYSPWSGSVWCLVRARKGGSQSMSLSPIDDSLSHRWFSLSRPLSLSLSLSAMGKCPRVKTKKNLCLSVTVNSWGQWPECLVHQPKHSNSS